MSKSIGLDIGGTKIAGALYDEKDSELAQASMPTPNDYKMFLDACRAVVDELEQKSGKAQFLGIGLPGIFDRATGFMELAANIPCISNMPLGADLERVLGRKSRLENDANCAALAEALEGAGKGYGSVFGLIMGTGVGGGFILNGRVRTGANGMCGGIGHLPLPSYEESDGERVSCGCGQKGCIEQFIAGAGLARLYESRTGKKADAKTIGALAGQGDAEALKVLDRYYSLVAKATVTLLHTLDPDIITVSGGLNSLPGLYDEVPKRWGQYAVCKKPKTKFVPASLGAMAGLRGAALMGREASGQPRT